MVAVAAASTCGASSCSRSALILYFFAAIAEMKRVPFDAPEGESEIVAGYFLEYSGMKLGMFMTGEFLEHVVERRASS